jgi:hypothetical protein
MSKEGTIGRLAEINRAESMVELVQELKDERSSIVKELVGESVIQLGPKGSGGFRFIGDDADENKELYLDYFNNF